MLAGINGSYNYYRNSSVLQEKEGTESTQDLKEEDSKVRDNKNEYGRIPVPKDQYIKSSEEEKESAGLYYLGKDENGNKKIFFNNPERPVEKCTGNTDAVDREIEKLKEKKKQLEKQIKEASGNEEKVKQLEMELAQIESELSQKDNDTYRRSHSSFISEV